MDTLTPTERSERMSRIRGKNTGPEWTVRRLIHGMGYRYRLHRRNLPGKPDLVFPARRKVIFVHGCFWHQHHGCKKGTVPASNVFFWQKKLSRNKERDIEYLDILRNMNWSALVIWECEAKHDLDHIRIKIRDFLES